jgi:peptidoglycan-associated lipoprotein
LLKSSPNTQDNFWNKEKTRMKLQFKRSFIICAVTALCSGGCAKHELVKQDQMIPPVTTAAPAPPAAPVVSSKMKPEAKDAGISGNSIRESQETLQAEQARQAQQAAQAAAAAAKSALDKVFFDFDSSTLTPQAREVLAKDAERLKTANAKVRIEGNCDELGSDDYNLALGEKRAKAALKYLQTMGIDPARISTISYGKEKPADPGHDEAARARNRRDEFVITSK